MVEQIQESAYVLHWLQFVKHTVYSRMQYYKYDYIQFAVSCGKYEIINSPFLSLREAGDSGLVERCVWTSCQMSFLNTGIED